MTKTLEVILIFILAVFSFCLGVRYSASVKEHAGWIFESSSDDVELPDLSDTQNPDVESPVDENGKMIDQATPPAEDQNIVPSIDENNVDEQEQNAQSAPESDTVAKTAPVVKKTK
jgi:hypothetical protein